MREHEHEVGTDSLRPKASRIDEPLDSRLWFFDLRTNTNRLLKVSRDPSCPVCAGI